MEKVFLFGAGNHSLALINILKKNKEYQIEGFLDTVREKGSYFQGYKIIGHQDEVTELSKNYNVIKGFVSIGDNYIRAKVTRLIKEKLPDFQFVNLIHPSVSIENEVTLGNGIAIMPGSIINPGSEIRDGCFINSKSTLGQCCVMHEYSSLSAGVTTGGKITFGEYSATLIGATLFDRISIGEHSLIGGGSLVTKDVPPHTVVYGRPAKVIRKRDSGEKYLK